MKEKEIKIKKRMKIIKKIQSSIGKFNLLGNEESLEFKIAIEEDDKICEVGGHKCVLKISNQDLDLKDVLDEDFEDGNFDRILKEAVKYANRVISSTDYLSQCLAFVRIYKESFIEIREGMKKQKEKQIKMEIERLEHKILDLKNDLENGNTEIPNVIIEMEENALQGFEKYKRWIAENEKEIAQLIGGSEKRKELQEKNKKYQAQYDEYALLCGLSDRRSRRAVILKC